MKTSLKFYEEPKPVFDLDAYRRKYLSFGQARQMMLDAAKDRKHRIDFFILESLASHLNSRTHRGVFPSTRTLADDVQCRQATALESLRRLQQRSLILHEGDLPSKAGGNPIKVWTFPQMNVTYFRPHGITDLVPPSIQPRLRSKP